LNASLILNLTSKVNLCINHTLNVQTFDIEES